MGKIKITNGESYIQLVKFSENGVEIEATDEVLDYLGELGWDRFGTLLVNGVLFKSLVAAADTPLIYVCAGWMRRRFGLLEGQEIEF